MPCSQDLHVDTNTLALTYAERGTSAAVTSCLFAPHQTFLEVPRETGGWWMKMRPVSVFIRVGCVWFVTVTLNV